MRPPEEWVIRKEPDLAIITPELFDAVRRNFDERAKQYGRGPDGKMKGHARGGTRSPALLSSLVKCGVCGGAMALIGGKKNPNTGEAYRQYQCAFAKRHGGAECANKLTISKKKLEQAVTAELVRLLLNDEAIAYFENEFRKAFAEEADRLASGTKKAELEKALNDEKVKIENLLGFIETGASQAVAGRLREAEDRAVKLKAEIETMTVAANQWETPPTKAIRNELLRLRDNLTGDDPASAKPMLKALVGELKLYPEKLTDAAEPAVKSVEEKKKTVKSEKTPRKEKSRATWGFRVVGSLFLENILVPVAENQVCPPDVAGAGFEPATFGL
ncbi:MAG: recombinase zinc beta ribbon domain-containing protein [Myxococcus sp.]|nr:recombinase zinc beta ribbon domain-containing protein [Myxococcus sp.]